MKPDNFITARLAQALALTDSLVDALDDAALEKHCGDARSNNIGSQFWCLVGARESYARAIKTGKWSGFSCSLEGAETKRAAAMREAMQKAGQDLFESIQGVEPDTDRLNLLFDLLEHEAQHHGQLIRYFYANDIEFPTEFADRYSL